MAKAYPLMLSVLLAAAGVSAPAFAAEVKITDEARRHFNAGVALLKDPDGARYEEAYAEFKVAYQASPSWKILGNLGLAAMKLERDGEAIDAFARYLEEGKKEIDASERADLERDLATLRASTVNVVLTTTPPQAVITDERVPVQGTPVRNRYQNQEGGLRLRVRPGHHIVTANVEGKPALRFEFDAEPGSSHEHHFDFDAPVAAPPPTAAPAPAPAPAPANTAVERPVPVGVWIGVALTGAFAVGTAVTGSLALSKGNEYDDANGRDPAKAKGLRDDVTTFNLVTDVLLGATVLSGGVTTYLYLRRPERPATGVSVKVSPAVGTGRAGLVLEGAF